MATSVRSGTQENNLPEPTAIAAKAEEALLASVMASVSASLEAVSEEERERAVSAA
jgi:hypothetical protein